MDLEQKADWSSVYAQPTPAEYLLQVRGSEYNVPDFACRFLRPLIDQKAAALGRPLGIMDLGASYAILPTMLSYGMTLEELVDLFVEGQAVRSLAWEEIERAYANLHRRRIDHSRYYLTDISQPAMDFAERLELCEQAFCIDMDHEEPPVDLLERIPEVDLYTAVGSLAYIGNTFFERVLPIINQHDLCPVFVFAVYRIFFPDALKDSFAAHGYTLRRVGSPLKKGRRFANSAEREWVVGRMREQGIETAGFEDDGYYGCEILMAERQDGLSHGERK